MCTRGDYVVLMHGGLRWGTMKIYYVLWMLARSNGGPSYEALLEVWRLLCSEDEGCVFAGLLEEERDDMEAPSQIWDWRIVTCDIS